jgi:hypothetical protein
MERPLWNSDDLEEAIDPIANRMWSAIHAMEKIRAQSVCGLAAKARVADLILRTNGKAHSNGP